MLQPSNLTTCSFYFYALLHCPELLSQRRRSDRFFGADLSFKVINQGSWFPLSVWAALMTQNRPADGASAAVTGRTEKTGSAGENVCQPKKTIRMKHVVHTFSPKAEECR